MGKSAQKSSSSSLPQWYQSGAENLMNQAQAVGQLPYMPWMMPDVAAASPQLMSAWDMPNQMANAFGMGGGGGGLAPGAQVVPGANPMFGGGHASFPQFNQNLAMLEAFFPGIMEAYIGVNPAAATAIEIDPLTGQPVGGRKGPATQGPMTEEQVEQAQQDEMDRLRWFQMRNESSDGFDPRMGPSNQAYAMEYDRLRNKFEGQDFGMIARG